MGEWKREEKSGPEKPRGAGRQVPLPSAVSDIQRNLHPEPQVNRPWGFPIHTHLLCLPHCSQAMNLGRQIPLARVERANPTMSVASLRSIALCRLCIASVLCRAPADGHPIEAVATLRE